MTDPSSPADDRPPGPSADPLPPTVVFCLRAAAEYSEPIQVNMQPHEWRALADHLGLRYTPNSRSRLS